MLPLKTLKSFLINLISLSLISNLSFAEDKVDYLEKGTPMPYSGFIFPISKAQDCRLALIEKEQYEQIKASYDRSIKLYKTTERISDDKLLALNQENYLLREQMTEIKSSNQYSTILWFGLGVLATGLSIYGAKQIIK